MLGEKLEDLASRDIGVVLPLTCVGEAWRTLTEVRGVAMSPGLVEFLLRRLMRSFPVILPTQRATRRWLSLASTNSAHGAATFDYQIASVCLEHDVEELWTFDEAFPRIPGLRVVNPLL